MCAAFEWKGRPFRPGGKIPAIADDGILFPTWAGFARSEILDWWLRRGGRLLDIPATRFAERSKVTGKLIWDEVPDGLAIRGLLEKLSPIPLVKIVTRASSPPEFARFEHPRMPVLEPPLHQPREILLPAEDDLFGRP